jgi:UDP-3-O-[3-hydroxymyristoyl] glucosamine N-acyltransferase
MTVVASLSEIVAALGGDLIGDPDRCVKRLASLTSAQSADIVHLAHPSMQHLLASTGAGVAIVHGRFVGVVPAHCDRIVVDHPALYWARLTQWWSARARPRPAAGIHASAIVEEGAWIHPGACVGPLVHVGAGARIGDGTVLMAQVHVGDGAVVGANCLLHPRVTLGYGCVLGERNVVLSGAVIGGDGFGNVSHDGRWVRIEQLGTVVTGDDCDIGANTCIDRGALDDTVLGDGVKLDNLIQVAHNCRIGDHTAIAACVGIAGSVTIGRHCMVGGAAMFNGHIEVCDHVFVSGGTLVAASIRKPGRYTGAFPCDDHAAWKKNAATLRQLHQLRERVRATEQHRPIVQDRTVGG